MQLANRGALRAASLRSSRVAKAARVVRANAAANRPLWFPGNPAPEYLDGSLAGDYGFDPLGLSAEPLTRRWMVQAELQNGRWAMLGVAGILFTALGAEAGLDLPQWYDAGKVAIKTISPFSFETLLGVQFLLFGWVESKRLADLLNPGSQGDGSFFGVTEDFKGVENGYPGGRFFDPFGLSRGDPAKYKEYKEKEIKNARLAMVAALGFFSQYAATGKGPIQNLVDHLNDPTHVTAATNGISVPFYP